MKFLKAGILLGLAGFALGAIPARAAVTFTIGNSGQEDIGAAGLGGSSITVPDFSFESPSSNNGGTNCGLIVASWSCNNTSNGGVYVPASGTQYAPGSDGLSGGHVVPDGSQVAYFVGKDTLGQTLTTNAVAGTTYTLSALAGQRKDTSAWVDGKVFMDLYAGGTVVNGANVGGTLLGSVAMNDPGSGLWALDTLTYTATGADAGKALSIVFDDEGTASGSQVNFDDVTLTTGVTTAFTPGVSTPSLNLFGSDADGGCDTDVDSFFNITNTKLCGDVFGVMGKSNGALSVNGSLGNYEFHVEDSNSGGNHSQQSGNLAETLTIGGQSAAISIPYTVTLGSNSDSFSIAASSTNVTIGGTTYTVITDATGPIGFSDPNRDDDDWAFTGILDGCVTVMGTACTGTLAAPAFTSFFTDDEPCGGVCDPVDAPEPSSLALFGLALAAFAGIRMVRDARVLRV